MLGRRHDEDETDVSHDDASLTLHEEKLELGTRLEEVGVVGARKRVETRTVADEFDREIEELDDVERVPPSGGDSGRIETLADGSVSIPVLEERLVVTKEIVVRERVILRKRTVTERERIETELRRERLELEADDPELLTDIRDQGE